MLLNLKFQDHKTILDTWSLSSTGETVELDLMAPRFLLYNNRPYLKKYFIVIAACLVTSESIYFVFVFLILSILKRDSAKFSRRSLRLHKQLTVLLAMQVSYA